MVQKKLPLINSAHGSETRNIINELIKLFNSMGYTYNEALQKAHNVLNEARQTNDMNVDVQKQVDELIIHAGESDAEVIQARGGKPLLKDRLEENESQLADIVTVNVKTFGAKGDGISNDFPAFKSAIEYLGTIGGGTIFFPDPNSTYLLNPTGMFMGGTKPITLSSNIEYLRLTGDNSKIKLDDGLSFSSFIHGFNKELVFKIDNLYFDGNATNNPHNTGATGNPRDNAHRLIEVYCKEVTIESTTFYDFHGVNIVVADRHPDLKSNEKSICQFINNKIERFGYDSSNSIHDSSALYSHVDYNSTEDGHYILATGNIFEGDSNTSYSNAYCAMELGGKNVICTNNITKSFYIGVIIAHQFVNDSIIITNNSFTDCSQGVTLWSYKNGGNILSTDTGGLSNVKINNNIIKVGLEYWKSRAVYSSYTFNGGLVTHEYAGITTTGNLYRDIKNIDIENNTITYDISNAPTSPSYNAIQIAEFTLSDPNLKLTFENIRIVGNVIRNCPTKPINILGRRINGLVIERNEVYGICLGITSGTRAVVITNKTNDNYFKNFKFSNNKLEEKTKSITYGLEIDAFNSANLTIENNEWDSEWTTGVIHINKAANGVIIDEIVPKDLEGDIVKLKECTLIRCNYKNPLRKLDTQKRLTYFVNLPNETGKTGLVGDMIESQNYLESGYVGYVCVSAGNPGTWKGYGLIEV